LYFYKSYSEFDKRKISAVISGLITTADIFTKGVAFPDGPNYQNIVNDYTQQILFSKLAFAEYFGRQTPILYSFWHPVRLQPIL
jgi:hypothetical protein